ncbi:MAG TPA: cytochrome c [Hyphomicrobiales bacterium]|nr:cytochrome c [Hyphomicrobiales bacterium]
MRRGSWDGARAPVWRRLVTGGAGGVAVLAAWLGFAAAAHAQAGGNASLVARGEYLARAADCTSCHTVPQGRPFAGGRAFTLPFGTIYAPNITADKKTGIGNWSDDDFVRALHEGVTRSGRHLYPAMPYTSYTLMSRDDILAIKAYLFSLPPVSQRNQRSRLRFPFDQRWGMFFWNLLFNPNHRFQPDPKQSPAWNRGAYLVEALGHCAECHTPRNIAMARDNGQAFAGAMAQGWTAYNITPDKQSGIGAWSDAALTSFLASGHAEGHSAAAGPMGEVVENSLRHLTKDDIAAIVTYLKTVRPIANAPAVATDPPARQSPAAPVALGDLGTRTFAGECAGCHAWDGSGVQSPAAALIGSRTVNDPAGTNLVNVMLEGVYLDLNGGPVFMPPFAAAHSNDEIAAVANFVNHRFGNGAAHVTAADVVSARHGNVEPWPDWWLWLGTAVAIIVALLVIRLIVWIVSLPFRRRVPA